MSDTRGSSGYANCQALSCNGSTICKIPFLFLRKTVHTQAYMCLFQLQEAITIPTTSQEMSIIITMARWKVGSSCIAFHPVSGFLIIRILSASPASQSIQDRGLAATALRKLQSNSRQCLLEDCPWYHAMVYCDQGIHRLGRR